MKATITELLALEARLTDQESLALDVYNQHSSSLERTRERYIQQYRKAQGAAATSFLNGGHMIDPNEIEKVAEPHRKEIMQLEEERDELDETFRNTRKRLHFIKEVIDKRITEIIVEEA